MEFLVTPVILLLPLGGALAYTLYKIINKSDTSSQTMAESSNSILSSVRKDITQMHNDTTSLVEIIEKDFYIAEDSPMEQLLTDFKDIQVQQFDHFTNNLNLLEDLILVNSSQSYTPWILVAALSAYILISTFFTYR